MNPPRKMPASSLPGPFSEDIVAPDGSEAESTDADIEAALPSVAGAAAGVAAGGGVTAGLGPLSSIGSRSSPASAVAGRARANTAAAKTVRFLIGLPFAKNPSPRPRSISTQLPHK